MKNKKVILSLAVLIFICLLGGFSYMIFHTEETSVYRNITDLESAYNADEDIAKALERFSTSQEKADLIALDGGGRRHIALTFDGLADAVSVQQILDLLKKYNAKATFFVDGLRTAEDPQIVISIKKAGQKVENYTLTGMPNMENLPPERLIKDFCRAQKIIKINTDQEANLLKCKDTQFTDQLLQAARASGFRGVVKSYAFLDVKKVNSLAAAENFVSALIPGSIISVELKSNVGEVAAEEEKTDLTPALDKQPGLKKLHEETAPAEKTVVEAVEKLLIALLTANYTTLYVEDFSAGKTLPAPEKPSFAFSNGAKKLNNVKKYCASYLAEIAASAQEEIAALFSFRKVSAAENKGGQAEEIKIISTVEQALSYTFTGLSDSKAADGVLAKLAELGIKGTFFVAEVEMQRYPDLVRKIIAGGHETALAIRPQDGETFDETRVSIVRGLKRLKEEFGVETNLLKQPYGAVTEATKEAVWASNCKLIGHYVNVVQSKHKNYNSQDEVMPEIFGASVLALGRGQIVHFRMDYYTNSRLVSDLIEAVKKSKVDNIAYITSFDNPRDNRANDSQYAIKPVGEIINNNKFIYQYPANQANVPPYLKNNGPAMKLEGRGFLAEASKRYIGTDTVTDEDRMLGFSRTSTRRLDKSGLIHTDDNVIFLTFDDWGTDASVNKLLYVLRKHNATGTFFVITNNVLNNPNLLRAIAREGHEVGSHTDRHRPMAVRDPKTGRQFDAQTKEERKEDVVTSYKKLHDIIGDVTVNEKPALTRFFRPPALAISKDGFEALLETGCFEYFVSGSYSTQDYSAQSVAELVRRFKDGLYTEKGALKKGAVLVMHMTDVSLYTAMALDILLTANEAKAHSDPSKFKVGRLSDYLKDGYSQLEGNKRLRLNSP